MLSPSLNQHQATDKIMISAASRAAMNHAKFQRRSVEVKSASSDVPTLTLSDPRIKGEESFDPTPALVLPLPRRPLFPGYYTSAFLKNQPGLAGSITGEKTVAAFMLKDAADYQGCILRPGLQGQELLERLYPVGTLAEVRSVALEENGRVILTGRRRVQMTGYVVEEDPLTVMVQPLEEEVDNAEAKKLDQLERFAEDVRSPMGMGMEAYSIVRPFIESFRLLEELSGSEASLSPMDIAMEAESIVRPFLDTFRLLEKLSGRSIWDNGGRPGWYLSDVWNGDIGFLADFGPAVMPVFDKGLHQRALEDPRRSRRLELATEILKRELELDGMSRKLDLKNEDDGYFEKERILAYLRDTKKTKLDFDLSPSFRGELLTAPSVKYRVLINEFHDKVPSDQLKSAKDFLKYLRFDEHMIGY